MSSPLAVKPKAAKSPNLAKSAMAVKGAGRMGDTELVHVNKDELNQMRQQWGEPTINPETGQPEFFLGFLKKLLPIATAFIPGIGPLASAAIGAGVGALDGGGWKGALGGGMSGAAGAGAMGSGTLGNAALQTAGSTLQGANPLTAFAGAYGANQLNNLSGANSKAPVTATSKAPSPGLAGTSGTSAIGNATGNAPSNIGADRLTSLSSSTVSPTLLPKTQYKAAATTAPPVGAASVAPPPTGQNIVAGDAPPTGGTPMPKQPNFWNRNFLGIKGLPNKYGIPLTALAVSALAGGGGNDGGDTGPPTQDQQNQFLNPVFKSSGRQPTGFNTNLSPVSSGNARAPIEAYYRAGSQPEQAYFNYVQHLAHGGQPNPAMAVKPSDNGGDESPLAVKGPGDGRSDSIPAKLSDGEYVMDAESVSMLGNGSNRAGANKLDSLRVNLRKQKGRPLAKGKMSPNAKEPASYIARKA